MTYDELRIEHSRCMNSAKSVKCTPTYFCPYHMSLNAEVALMAGKRMIMEAMTNARIQSEHRAIRPEGKLQPVSHEATKTDH